MQELLAVAAITVLAVISPGGDFAMVSRNSYLYGRRAGLLTAAGIACGVWIHVAYTLLGVGLLLQRWPAAFFAAKILGALYLIYMGIQTFRHRPVTAQADGTATTLGAAAAFRTGLATNALNPKTTLFVLSTFSQIVSPHTPLWQQIGYGAWMSAAHGIWFAFVAVALSAPHLRQALLARQVTVNRVIGCLLAGLGVLLACSD
ncbi:LysE family translocator [Neisseria shayeganii]|uniref:LysE family transporter n=1 Tax=Neisseria shayeganii 871 TaxID=1032488 RepID=G4CEY5_9NEIS|nr:LysE family transporter [Neisseria shayeganii]EGY53619.1 LysE family transporter [Neisseria shayeganii 871]